MATQKPAKPVVLKSNRFVESPSFRKNQAESFLKTQINSGEKSSRQKPECEKLRIKKSVKKQNQSENRKKSSLGTKLQKSYVKLEIKSLWNAK